MKGTYNKGDEKLFSFIVTELHAAADELRATFLTITPSKRQKRWLDLISIGLGAFNTYQSLANKAAINSNTEAINALAVQIKATSQLQLAQTQILLTLKDAVNDYYLAIDTINNVLLLTASAQGFLQKTTHFTQELQSSIKNQQIGLGLITAKDFSNTFNTLLSRTKAINRNAYINDPSQLASLPATFSYQDKFLIATITVPLFQENSEQLQVLKAAPALILENNGHLMRFSSDNVILKGRDRMIVLTDEDFNLRCAPAKGIPGCTLGVIHHNAPSCEADLLAGVQPSRSNQCRHQVKILDPTVEVAVQSDRNTFDWFVPEPTVVVIECEMSTESANITRARTSQLIDLKGLSRITLPPRCRATSKDVSVAGVDPLVSIQIDTTETIPQTVFQELIEGIQLPSPHAWANLSETIRRLRTEADDPSLQRLLDNAETSLIFSEATAKALPSDTLLILVITSTIGMIAIPVFMCCRHRLRRPSCVPNCLGAQMPELPEVIVEGPPPVQRRRFQRALPREPPTPQGRRLRENREEGEDLF